MNKRMFSDRKSENNTNRIEVITEIQRCGRWTPEQKLELIKQTFEPGIAVLMVASELGIAAAQVLQWKKAHQEASLFAVDFNESVVLTPKTVEALKRIKPLEGAFDRKTLENKILKKAIEYGKARKWIARSPLLSGDEQ